MIQWRTIQAVVRLLLTTMRPVFREAGRPSCRLPAASH